jgi:glucose-1-phosphate thymidylyltransferase
MEMMLKAIILAGGQGTRLYPMTAVFSKQLQPVYDKPMVYYPLTMLMLLGIREICVVATPEDTPNFQRLLGDGSRWGIDIQYRIQAEPGGLAHGFLVAQDWIGGAPCGLILGDNLFYGKMNQFSEAVNAFSGGALIFGYPVSDPSAYGVLQFDRNGAPLDIIEKPAVPPSSVAVPGLYFYDHRAVEFCEGLKPSPRGQLEITDLNRAYLKRDELKVCMLGRGVTWLDTGTPDSLSDAAEFVKIVEHRQGLKIGCPEEAALRTGFIELRQMKRLVEALPVGSYRAYLHTVLQEAETGFWEPHKPAP